MAHTLGVLVIAAGAILSYASLRELTLAQRDIRAAQGILSTAQELKNSLKAAELCENASQLASGSVNICHRDFVVLATENREALRLLAVENPSMRDQIDALHASLLEGLSSINNILDSRKQQQVATPPDDTRIIEASLERVTQNIDGLINSERILLATRAAAADLAATRSVALLMAGTIIGVTLLVVSAHLLDANIAVHRQLAEMNARQAAIVESAEDAILTSTLDMLITSWNKSAERILGRTAKEVIGTPITNFYPKDYLPEAQEINKRIRRGERITRHESERVRADGELVPVSLTISPIFDRQGNVVEVAAIVHDITSRRKLEAERENAIRDLERALANVKTLTGLVPICSYCKRIRDDKDYWHQVDMYVAQHTHAQFSHSLCPQCYQTMIEGLENHRPPDDSES